MNITTENTFETALVQSLVEQGGYTEGNAPDYSPELGIFKYEVIMFLQNPNPNAGIKSVQFMEKMPPIESFKDCTKSWIYEAVWMCFAMVL